MNEGGKMIVSEDQHERRNLFRMGIECPVQISGLGEGRETQGRVLDLSGSGMAIECSEALTLGSRFRVKVAPDKPIFMPLVADVEVVRMEEGNGGGTIYGLKICELLS